MLIQSACDSSKTSIENPEKKEMNTNKIHEKLISEGYSFCVIKRIEDSKCPYMFIDENTKEQFDPINIEEEGYASFKSTDSKIYIKFRRLRMPSRCNEAQPISLEDIKKRED